MKLWVEYESRRCSIKFGDEVEDVGDFISACKVCLAPDLDLVGISRIEVEDAVGNVIDRGLPMRYAVTRTNSYEFPWVLTIHERGTGGSTAVHTLAAPVTSTVVGLADTSKKRKDNSRQLESQYESAEDSDVDVETISSKRRRLTAPQSSHLRWQPAMPAGGEVEHREAGGGGGSGGGGSGGSGSRGRAHGKPVKAEGQRQCPHCGVLYKKKPMYAFCCECLQLTESECGTVSQFIFCVLTLRVV